MRVGRFAVALTTLLSVGSVAYGQAPAPEPNRKAQATRAELEATLVNLEAILGSAGYSGRLRAAKRREAEMIRGRLTNGDLNVGDQVQLTVRGDSSLSGVFIVGAGRELTLPGVRPIGVGGVLRAEIEDHLKKELTRYVRNPDLRARTLIRLSIFGAVGKPGFYQVPADLLAGETFMIAGGPTPSADPRKGSVSRAGSELIDKESFQDALTRGVTLDQLNLLAGDELYLGSRSGNTYQQVLALLGGVTAISYLFIRLNVF